MGIILIVVGVLLFIWTGFSYTKQENVIDAGPLQVNVESTERVNWPPYTGGIAIVCGFALILLDKRNRGRSTTL